MEKTPRLTWKNLQDQFGRGYADPKNFKRKMEETRISVREVYPGARIKRFLGDSYFFHHNLQSRGLKPRARPPKITLGRGLGPLRHWAWPTADLGIWYPHFPARVGFGRKPAKNPEADPCKRER